MRNINALLNHLRSIDALCLQPNQRGLEDEMQESMSDHEGKGFSAPWIKSGQYAVTHDTDGDGVPDAFDDWFGPGAVSPFNR